MKLRALPLTVGLLGVSLLLAPTASGQFHPEGRHKRPKTPVQHSRGTRPSKPASVPHAAPKGPSVEALIKRYQGIVLSDPSAPFPLQRLAELYRQRDGNLDALIAQLEHKASEKGKNQFNALLALAGIYRQDGQQERAQQTYDRALAQQPKNAIALVALARLLADRGDQAGARKRYEQALPLINSPTDKELTLRTLIGLCLDTKDFDAAKKYHKELVRRAHGSFFVRSELGRELMQRGEYERAVKEYRETVKAAGGDNRVLAPALRDLGAALTKAGKADEAVATLRHALRIAGSQSGVKREIYGLIADVYRQQNRLPDLISDLEKDPHKGVGELKLLGGLYEESGQIDKALSVYRRALSANSRDMETRLKVVRLLQIQGELDQAITEYEALIAAAPHNPDFVFQLAEALIQRGERDKALAQLARLEARSAGDPDTMSALADFYERMGEQERAVKLQEHLAAITHGDPRFLVDLGNRYWDAGDKKKAETTWIRIKTAVQDRVKALTTLGDVYLNHDMTDQALDAYRQAVKLKPDDKRVRRALAIAVERAGAAAQSQDERSARYDDARRIWEKLLEQAGSDDKLARDARQHIVRCWKLAGELPAHVEPLERRLRRNPPDADALDAGRLLGEVQMQLMRFADAERALRRVVQYAPGDVQSLQNLERALVRQHKLDEAIGVLKKLVHADAKEARRYYQQMATYSAELYRDDDAIRYAERAVELSPDDAEGHRKLGEMYAARQNTTKAIESFRKAISKNDRLFPVYLELADLLIAKGDVDEADRLLRRVVRSSPDEDLVAKAARLAMQVDQPRGKLGELERELFAVALGNPQKPIYRRLLIELYRDMTYSLVLQAKSEDPKKAEQAKKALERLGERAVKPLLDALADTRDAQQRVAIELLTHIRNKGAGPALFAFATGDADSKLRARAMLAVGTLEDPSLLPKLKSLLVVDGEVRTEESDPVLVAAAWSVAKLGSSKASGLLEKMLDSPAPSLRTLAVLGLLRSKDHRAVARIVKIAQSPVTGPLPRAAAAFALGELGTHAELRPLAELAESSDSLVRSSAIVALARLSAGKHAANAVDDAALDPIARALTSPDPFLVEAGTAAALVLATGDYRAPSDPLELPQGKMDLRALLRGLVPHGYTDAEHAQALVALGPAISRAAAAAVQSSAASARALAEAIRPRKGHPAFGPLSPGYEGVDADLVKKADAAAERIASAVVSPFIALAGHPSSEIRAMAVQVLASRPEPKAAATVIEALGDRDSRVRNAALAAVAEHHTPGAAAAVARLLTHAVEWPLRRRAAAALGELPEAGPSVRNALARAATEDDYSLVREAAARSLTKVDPTGCRAVLSQLIEKDPEPRVRAAAPRLLDSTDDAREHQPPSHP